MQDLTQQGIDALKAGDRAAARRLLAAAVDRDQKDATAWLWLAAALNNDADRATCLRQVLRLDPENKAARRGLAEILERQRPSKPVVAAAQDHVPVVPQRTVVAPQVAEQEPGPEPEMSAAPVIALPETMAPDSMGAGWVMEAAVAEPVAQELPAASELPAAQEAAANAAAAATAAGAATTAVAQPLEPAETAAAAAVAPVPEDADSGLAYRRRRARHEAERAAVTPPQVIFNARASQVPALICFWLFLIGAAGVGALLGQFPALQEPVHFLPGNPALSLTMNVLVGFVLAILLELLVLYVIIRNLFARYQLTDRQLNLRYHGQGVHLDHAHLKSVECRQDLLQKLTGAGDIEVEAVVNGQLALLRLRNVSGALEKTAQIQSVIPLS
jgi:hypothetical protein